MIETIIVGFVSLWMFGLNGFVFVSIDIYFLFISFKKYNIVFKRVILLFTSSRIFNNICIVR